MKELFYCIRNKKEINPIMEKIFSKDDGGDVVIVTLKDLSKTSIVIPEKIEGYPVTEIGQESFKYTNVKIFELPSTILSIKENAFPNNVTIKYLEEKYDENTIYYAVKKHYQEVLNEQVDGVIEAVYQQDKLLDIVRKCKTIQEAYEKLAKEFGLTIFQVQTILSIPISVLQSLDVSYLESLKIDLNN